MFKFAEEALDEVALAVDGRIDRSLNLAVALGWDVGVSAALCDQVDQVLPVIAAICDDDGGGVQPFQQRWRGGLVGGLARCESEADRQSVFVDDDMDLAGQSSTRTADGVDVPPLNRTVFCWNFPLMIPRWEKESSNEGIKVFGSADRVRFEAG